MLINQLGNATDGANVHSLAALSNSSVLWNKNFALGRDIDAAATRTWNGGTGFNPIGNGVTQFIGVFDGMNNTLNNLYINRTTNYVGLFGYVRGGGILSNLNLANANITGFYEGGYGVYVGGIAGINSGVINSITVNGGTISGRSITSAEVYIGGVAGNNSGTISNVMVSDAAISGQKDSNGSIGIGGVTGYNSGTIIGAAINGGGFYRQH